MGILATARRDAIGPLREALIYDLCEAALTHCECPPALHVESELLEFGVARGPEAFRNDSQLPTERLAESRFELR